MENMHKNGMLKLVTQFKVGCVNADKKEPGELFYIQLKVKFLTALAFTYLKLLKEGCKLIALKVFVALN